MLVEFRHRYPKGSLISELVQIDHGQYIVRVLVQVEGITLATALSASNNLEEAEDRAIKRALSLLSLNSPTIPSLPEEKLKIVKNSATTSSVKSTSPPANNGVTKLALETVNNQSVDLVSPVPPSPVETSIKPAIETSEMIALINMELARIGWKIDQGREYLLATYGKKSRHMLSDEELSDFLQHLQNEPTYSE